MERLRSPSLRWGGRTQPGVHPERRLEGEELPEAGGERRPGRPGARPLVSWPLSLWVPPRSSRPAGLGGPLVQSHVLFSMSLVWGRAGVGRTRNCDSSLSLIFSNFYSFEFREPRAISTLCIQLADEESRMDSCGLSWKGCTSSSFHWLNLIMWPLLLAKDTGKCSPALSPGK